MTEDDVGLLERLADTIERNAQDIDTVAERFLKQGNAIMHAWSAAEVSGLRAKARTLKRFASDHKGQKQ